jgi:murein L,D-transpeptidase YcbB/YkuD
LATKKLDVAEFLRNQLLTATDVRAAVEEIEPPFRGYRRTLQALEHYLSLANEGEGTPIPAPTFPLRKGNRYAGATPLAERLRRLGDLGEASPLAPPNIYGGALVAAIKQFQKRHGLYPHGRLTQETYNELVTPFSRRVIQLQLTLERLRWLPPTLESPLIMVNIPEFQLRAYEDHSVTLSMGAIVGEALEHQTPVFADRMEAVVFRPDWNVPESIQKKELVPELRKHRHYLVRYGMQVVDSHGKVITEDRVSAKVLRQLESGTLRLRQLPGPANALGLVKFVFPNQYDVYMHGTPERGLFGRSRRDLSHGCIRIEDPAALAAWVLRDDPQWTPDRVNAAMHGENSIKVKVPRGIPILILYGTAVVDENGTVHFFRDIYGLDATLQTALEDRHERSQ